MSSEETKNLDSAKDSEPKVQEIHIPSIFKCNPDESLGMMYLNEDDNNKGDIDASKTQQSA